MFDKLLTRAHTQARRSISPWFMTMGLRRCDRKLVGASSGSLRRPLAFNSLSICNARRHALCSPSTSWVNSKASPGRFHISVIQTLRNSRGRYF